MSAVDAFADMLAEDGKREPWFIEAKDKNPASEFQRQTTFLALLAKLGPTCDVVAIPNAGKSSDWERIRRHREGARAGALDLFVTWPGGGIFFAEFKDGKKMPSEAQMDRLDLYMRQGHGCGIFRTGECLIEHLRNAGAPIRAAIIA